MAPAAMGTTLAWSHTPLLVRCVPWVAAVAALCMPCHEQHRSMQGFPDETLPEEVP